MDPASGFFWKYEGELDPLSPLGDLQSVYWSTFKIVDGFVLEISFKTDSILSWRYKMAASKSVKGTKLFLTDESVVAILAALSQSMTLTLSASPAMTA